MFIPRIKVSARKLVKENKKNSGDVKTQEINKISFKTTSHDCIRPESRTTPPQRRQGKSQDRTRRARRSNLPSTCPPVFFTSSSAIFIPLNASVFLASKKFFLHWRKRRWKEERKRDIHWRLDSSKPFPRKQNRSAHVKLSQAHTVLTQIAHWNRRDWTQPIQTTIQTW